MRPALPLGLLALVAGALIPAQAAANAALSKSLQGNVPFAALSLFAVAGVTTLLVTVVSGASPPTPAAFTSAPLWSYAGGVIVAFYVWAITLIAPRLGVGAAISLVVTGQILAALIIDHLGLLRAPVFPVTGPRLVGAALMIVGAVLAVRREPPAGGPPLTATAGEVRITGP